jgi:hypothetical protein
VEKLERSCCTVHLEEGKLGGGSCKLGWTRSFTGDRYTLRRYGEVWEAVGLSIGRGEASPVTVACYRGAEKLGGSCGTFSWTRRNVGVAVGGEEASLTVVCYEGEETWGAGLVVN